MKKKKFQKYGILIFLVIIIGNIITYIFFPNSFSDYLKKEYFPRSLNGNVYGITVVKGGSLSLIIHTESKDDGITIKNSEQVETKLKKYIYFRKLPSSNQCYVIKGDSIMYFNCYDRSFLGEKDSISIGEIKEWDNKLMNHWIYKK